MKFLGGIRSALSNVLSKLSARALRTGNTMPMTRRQVRRSMEALYPKLKSGRQWRIYRKTLRRTTGIDLLKHGA
jgi:hypothetical protein